MVNRLNQAVHFRFGFVFVFAHLFIRNRMMNMSALYNMKYLGAIGLGFGALYIGKGIIVGSDSAGGRYHGTYTESGGRMIVTIILSMPNGGTLVTGAQIPAGTDIPLSADWPVNFADGTARSISVLGSEVQVTFEKVGDIP